MKSAAASPDLSGLPVLKVLLRARAEGRMPHAVLLTGADLALLERVVEKLAAIHLEDDAPLAHPDCRVLRPAKKSRRINVESTSEVVSALHLSSLASRRVIIVHEPDRFQPEAANAFLKSLEEPPPGTLILLHTTSYYRILPTILSRCLRFHVAGEAPVVNDPAWLDWLREFERLLARMISGPTTPGAKVSEVFMPLYGLCARFEVLQELFLEEALEAAPPPPAAEDPDEQKEVKEAHEEAIRRGVRGRMLLSVEERLRLAARAHPAAGAALAEAVGHLEAARSRLELNYQALASVEQFLLQTLRTLAVRPRPAASA